MKRPVILSGLLVALVLVFLIPVGGGAVTEERVESVPGVDLSGFPAELPESALRLLFIHHSCGGHWLAEAGSVAGDECIYETHPEGGGLRAELEGGGYEVHEASYGSEIGQDTDVFDWPPKFRLHMDRILSTDHQDRAYADERRNQIVVFKSCYPNNYFFSDADEATAGDPAGPELTIPNAQAAYRALLPEFARQPDVLFICVTAPPFAPWETAEPLWKRLARFATGRPTKEQMMLRGGARARRFGNWLKSPDGWLKDYELRNVVVFDLFDVLTGEGASNLSRYPTGDGHDSHPSRAGSEKASAAFVPFLNRAVRRMGRGAERGQ